MLCTALLYGLSLAPTVLWGDDAMFQMALARGSLTNHPLWGILARVFARVPLGDMAFRANLASSVYAVGAITFLYLAALGAGGGVRAALGAGITLAISHTFWLESVRAEVYTLHLMLFFAGLWMLLRWRSAPQHQLWLCGGLILWGVGTVNHLLLTVALPGGLWLILSSLPPAARKRALVEVLAALVLSLLALWLFARGFLMEVVVGAARVVLETFSLSPSRLVMHLVLLVYQTPLLGLFSVPGTRWLWGRDRVLFLALGCMGVCTAVFASTHGILESYVFYLPGIGLLALLIGLGIEQRTSSWPAKQWLVAAVIVVCLQAALYRITPLVVNRFAPGVIPSRNLPGRDAATFFLWPPKRGYLGARRFAETTLKLLPPNSMLIADWTLQTPICYLQEVENHRTDVLVVQVDPIGMSAIWQNEGQRPLYLSNADPRYYPMDELRAEFRLIPVGHIYELRKAEDNP